MLTIYGIPNCDTCRKARKWLEAEGVAHRFHDLREDGLDRAMLERWSTRVDWKKLLNTRSTTWRGLAAKEKQDLDAGKAIALMLEHPTLVKRPVAETGSNLIVGFSTGAYLMLE